MTYKDWERLSKELTTRSEGGKWKVTRRGTGVLGVWLRWTFMAVAAVLGTWALLDWLLG